METAEISETERAALTVLRMTGVDVLEAALVAKEVLAGGRVKRARLCIQLGKEQLRLREKTVSFGKAVETALDDRKRKGLRERSIVDFRYLCKRMMRLNPGLAQRRVRSMAVDECRECLESAFGGSPSQYKKARAIMSGVFSTAVRHGWCDSNPVSAVEPPKVEETPVTPLTLADVRRLEEAARRPEHREMQLSLHLMLYCGIRPTEVSRINPERDIDWQGKRVIVRAAISKTGGGREVPLRCRVAQGMTPRIPRGWRQRWRALREAAGWRKETERPWRPDVCRHTFATYHAAYFKNLQTLQMEMGHHDLSLLRTRYVHAAPQGDSAASFWGVKEKAHLEKPAASCRRAATGAP